MRQNDQFLLKNAISAFKKNDFLEAITYLKSILFEKPENINTIFELGIALIKIKNYAAAIHVFNSITAFYPKDVKSLFNLGVIYSLQGNYHLALKVYETASEIEPNDIDLLLNLACAYIDTCKFDSALIKLDKIIESKPEYLSAWLNKGIVLHHLGFLEASVNAYDTAIAINFDCFEAWSNKSLPLVKLGRLSDALTACDTALGIKSDYAEALFNKGFVLQELNRFEEALIYYDKALSLKPIFSKGLFSKAMVLHILKRYEDALTYYDKALSLKPDFAKAWSNKGNVFQELCRYQDALLHYDKALSLNPNYVEVWVNKGILLQELGRHKEALTHYETALSLKSDYAEAWSNMGNLLQKSNHYLEALDHYDRALNLNSNVKFLFGDFLHLKMIVCDWSNFQHNLNQLIVKLSNNKLVSIPFPLLSLIDNPILHRISAETYINEKYPFNTYFGSLNKYPKKNKIRIAYFSSDFRNHPVSFLTAELFELHNKNKFETFAISYGADDKSPIRSRLMESFTQFIDVSAKTDLEVVQLARNLEIDIAIDLGGHTSGGRIGIFACRVAPIQVSYIGYLGTMGAKYYDYLLADSTLIPNGSDHFYSEKIVYLPCYQANDRKRSIANRQFTKHELGLPKCGFIFCCFNNNFKILPTTFNCWMRILKAIEGSVLFLFSDNALSKANLINEAVLCGIDSSRLVFGERIAYDEYLSRYQVCDLFLDTFPYNAGTTASDALWAGLPVLTLVGQSFASRVAASLLNAIDMPELITSSQEEYEALAIELAKNPEKLNALKAKLAANRLTTPLFDTPLFTKNLEKAYTQMYERYQADMPVDHIVISP